MIIWQMSLWASLVILAAVVIRSVALHKIPKITFLLMWGLALIRLLIPFQLDIALPFQVSDVPVVGQIQNASQIILIPAEVIESSGAQEASTPGAASFFWPVLIWISIAVCIFLYFTISHIRYSRMYRFAVPTDNVYVNNWQKKNVLRFRSLKVKVSPDISAPLTYGFFRPTILLPKTTEWENREQLQYVMTHEMTHIRRFDTLWKWLLMIAVCVHWFNPLVWVMYVLANRDLEITCDEKVIRTLGINSKTPYALTLIGLAEEQAKIMPLGSAFSKNALKERVISIMKIKKRSLIGAISAVAIIISTTGVLGVTAMANSQVSGVVPQNTNSDYEMIDGNGDLIYYRTTDEDGNDVYLDYVREKTQGDVLMDGVYFYGKEIDCINGISGEHEEDNAHMAVYTNNGGTWALKAGQEVTLTLNVKATPNETNGWYMMFGYLNDGVYTECSAQRISSGESTLTFIVPQDGEYCPFILNASAGAIYVNNCTITVK